MSRTGRRPIHDYPAMLAQARSTDCWIEVGVYKTRAVRTMVKWFTRNHPEINVFFSRVPWDRDSRSLWLRSSHETMDTTEPEE